MEQNSSKYMSGSIQSTAELEEEAAAEEEDEIQYQSKKKKKKRKKELVRKMRGAKNLIFSPIRKFEKLCTRKQRRPPPPPFPYSEEFSMGCHLCFTHPKVALDSPTRPHPHAKPSSYHDFLRSMIESNDFYSPECNVHMET